MNIEFQGQYWTIKNGTYLQEMVNGKWKTLDVIQEKKTAWMALRNVKEKPTQFRIYPFRPMPMNERNNILQRDNEARGEFFNKVNERCNFFGMEKTGVKDVDDHRIRVGKMKEASLKKKIKCQCDDGKIRYVEFEHSGVYVKLICTHLKPQTIEIGEEIVRIEKQYQLLVLKLKKYSGTKPSQAMTYEVTL